MEEFKWEKEFEEEYSYTIRFQGEPILTYEEYNEFSDSQDAIYGKLYDEKILKNDSINIY